MTLHFKARVAANRRLAALRVNLDGTAPTQTSYTFNQYYLQYLQHAICCLLTYLHFADWQDTDLRCTSRSLLLYASASCDSRTQYSQCKATAVFRSSQLQSRLSVCVHFRAVHFLNVHEQNQETAAGKIAHRLTARKVVRPEFGSLLHVPTITTRWEYRRQLADALPVFVLKMLSV